MRASTHLRRPWTWGLDVTADSGNPLPSPPRRTLFDDLDTSSENIYCRRDDLENEASVETFFCTRMLKDFGYKDSQIKPKKALDELVVGHGSRREKYKPDYALMVSGKPRCIVDAKATDEPLDKWLPQVSGYAHRLNQKYRNENPVRFAVLTNGLMTRVYEWDKDTPALELEFSEFSWGHDKYEEMKALLSASSIVESTPPERDPGDVFTLKRPTSEKARQLFSSCHQAIWKAEVCSPSAAFMSFVKVLVVKLWEDRKLREQPATSDAFSHARETAELPASAVMFSVRWIERREDEGTKNPINGLFEGLRDKIEEDIRENRKKRIFAEDEQIDLRPATVKEVVRRLEHYDLFGIDEDLNGRLFETFLSATMRGRELGQFFTPRSVVKMMTELADLTATREQQDRVIDACCGSGGFLIEALTEMRNQVRENDSLSGHEKEDLINSISNECLYGIDAGKDPPIARIARINMYLHGDGGSRIYYADALDKEVRPPDEDIETRQDVKELRELLNNKDVRFDVALTNPPFSMTKEKKKPTERKILEQYRLGTTASGSLRASLRSNIMFMERYFDLLRPGGRLITVIDETLLSSPNYGWVRDFLRDGFLVRGIISLPGDTFRRSGSRMKTSILLLERKRHADEEQPTCFGFFAEHVGVDDLTPRASDAAVREARDRAYDEMDQIVAEYHRYLDGKKARQSIRVPPERLQDRLDLKNVAGRIGRMRPEWEGQGMTVKKLKDVLTPVERVIEPADHPEEEFILISVSYDGYCREEDRQLGMEIRAKKMFRLREGDLVFSTHRATNGAIAVVSPELDGALASYGSYEVFDCGDLETTAYVRGILRSHEIRADMQSISRGSSRYTTPWPEMGELEIPWPSAEKIRKIGGQFIKTWKVERRVRMVREKAQERIAELGVESEESVRRFKQSEAPT